MRGRALLFSILAIVLFAVLVAGCRATGLVEGAAGPSGEDTEVDIEASQESVPEATVGLTATLKPSGESVVETAAVAGAGEKTTDPTGPAFIASPESNGGHGHGADGILAIRYGEHEEYEQVVVDLGVGTEPAGSVPEWTLTSPAGDGLLRLSLSSANTTTVSGGKLGDGLLKNFHVVRAPEGGMFVDVFAREAFVYRVIELVDPARIAVDFKPAEEAELTVPLPAEGGSTVLLEPRAGERASNPLTISGYSRNVEANNTITLTNVFGETVAHKTVQSNDWSTTWGYFETTLELPPFKGKGILRVGTETARDGSFEGVEIPVYGRQGSGFRHRPMSRAR